VSNWNSGGDILYSNALFEHLDEPREFLRSAMSNLKPGGKLLMRLPLITLDNYVTSETGFDINFWKPCHRVLYTLKGLKTLLRAHHFEIVDSAGYVYYGYKVMSAMLQHGYRDIELVRDPCLPIKGLDSDRTYKKMLFHGLLRKTICSDFALIAAKLE
jgi:methyltransferase family protein